VSPPLDTQIRFTRLGRKRTSFYRIIAIDSRKRRDGLPLEYLGWYDPHAKQSNLDAPAIKAWLAKGAQPSDTVRNLLKKSLIMD
jgi:small subunit ribosomal protein S16